MKNLTVVFQKPKNVVVEDREEPDVKGDGVLIRARRSLVSMGSELTILSRDFPPQSYWASYGKYPFTAGYDNIGVVVDVGPDADRSLIGRIVASSLPIPCMFQPLRRISCLSQRVFLKAMRLR